MKPKNGKQKSPQSSPSLIFSCFTICYSVIYGILCTALMLVCIIVTVDLSLESMITPVSYELPAPPVLRGPLKQNTLLRDRSERLYEDQLTGPESLVLHDGHIYTGTADGKILDLFDGKIRVLAQLGKPPCGGYDNEPNCGRPLGMRLTDQGQGLLVLDAYQGLYKVNIKSGSFQQLLSSSDKIGGHTSAFLNDLAVTADGATAYITDSSTKWNRRDFLYSHMEHIPLGRLIQFDLKTKTSKILMTNLYFANGVQLSPDEDYLLVADTFASKILRYNLKGPNAGLVEDFADNLPGSPDNIRPSSSGGYWVSLHHPRHSQKFNFAEFLSDKPWFRNFVSKVLTRERIYALADFKYGLVIEINGDGEIIRSLHDPLGEVVHSASETHELDGTLYVGSFCSPFLVKVKL